MKALGFVSWFLMALSLVGLMGLSCVPSDIGDAGDAGDTDDADTDDSDTGPPHDVVFSEAAYEGAASCLACHADVGEDILQTGHWNWQGTTVNIEGLETEIHGKVDYINNFCIAIASNEPRCTQCHIGIGWSNNEYDLTDANNIDCLICHDTTGTYTKEPKTAGAPPADLDLDTVAQNVGTPGRANCGFCHFKAGGGDNVKHGDLSSDLVATTREFDVHMGTDGQDMACQECHAAENHGMAGMPLHSVDEGSAACTDCHDTSSLHAANPTVNNHLDRVACQTCHIPTFARALPTKLEWYWEDAGQDIDPIPTDEYGMATYNKLKGSFVWGKAVEPTLMWFNGKWDKRVVGVNDQYTETPVVMAAPLGSKDDANAKIYPFKKMIGNQPADANNQTLLVPHLFGMGAGENPYWVKYDWDLALEEGAAYAGQEYSGEYEFVDTVMYLSINHEIAPKEEARQCGDCHFGGIDFTALGYEADPMGG